MTHRFLDTNVILRYLIRDNEDMAKAALALLMDIERGDQQVLTSPMVIFETVFTLQTHFRVPREHIRTVLKPVINLDGLLLDEKQVFLRVLDTYVDVNVSFADAFNAAYMTIRGSSEMYTWDRGMSRIEGIVQVEPPPADDTTE